MTQGNNRIQSKKLYNYQFSQRVAGIIWKKAARAPIQQKGRRGVFSRFTLFFFQIFQILVATVAILIVNFMHSPSQ